MSAGPGPERPFFAPRDDLPPAGSGRPRSRRPLVLGGLAAAVLAAVFVVLVLGKEGREREEREATQARVATLRATIARQQAPRTGAAAELRPRRGASAAQRRAARAALVAAVEGRILQDARARAITGELDRRPTAAECGPQLRSREAVPDDRDLRRPIGRYDCVAVVRDIQGGGDRGSVGRLGFAFVAALDFRDFTFTWCRNNPAQGERGRPLVFVRLERACLAARGRALGTGYAQEPDG